MSSVKQEGSLPEGPDIPLEAGAKQIWGSSRSFESFPFPRRLICDTLNRGWHMRELRKTRRLQAIAVATGDHRLGGRDRLCVSSAIDFPGRAPSVPVSGESRSANQADGNQASISEPLPLGSLLGCNRPAPPPASISVGRSIRKTGTPDLSTPAATVYSVLSLIDQGATGKLAPCLFEETGDPVSSLYPRYLGPPVGLREVIEDDQSAKVTWNATVHTEFSCRGRQWSPGETITLTARLVRVGGLWKLQQLHEGDKDGPQSHDAPAN